MWYRCVWTQWLPSCTLLQDVINPFFFCKMHYHLVGKAPEWYVILMKKGRSYTTLCPDVVVVISSNIFFNPHFVCFAVF